MTEQDLEAFDSGLLDERELETQNRLRNLMWTVSGDYALDTRLDIASFRRSKYISLYDAVKQGAFARCYDKDALAAYLLKKVYLGASSAELTELAQLCVDSAVYPHVISERPGVKDIREEAFVYLLEHRFRALSESRIGRLKLAFMRSSLTGDWAHEGRIRIPLEKVRRLGAYASPRAEAAQTAYDGGIVPGGVEDARIWRQSEQAEGIDAQEQPRQADPAGAGWLQPSQDKDAVPAQAHVTDTQDIIRTIDELYNLVVDPHFEQQHGTLDVVQRISLHEMKGSDWQQFLEEEAGEALLEQAAQRMLQDLTTMDSAQSDEEEDSSRKKIKVVQVDQEAAAKMYSYIEKNFGRSYLSEKESRAINHRLCKGAHADCRLFYTEGIIRSHVMVNAQYVNANKQARDNERYYLNHRRVTRQNIDTMTQYLKRSLQLRSQKDQRISDHGTIVPARVWRVGRLPDPGKLFVETTRQNQNDFAVEVLIDASGSQHVRQAQVALQAYIISCALSRAGFPHEIMSFCSFWDYTVMQRFRQFDEPKEADERVLQFTTSSNNRDGLAIRAAGDALDVRPEEHKILIILSDGRPNDVIVGRPGSRNPAPYTGEYALRDTAFEVRALRSRGIYVLGVFTGTEKDLTAEKKIFGKDFAYIREIRNFSKVVSSYLTRLLEQELV